MKQARDGDTVTVHYTGKLDDGTVFDSSTERTPLEVTIGENRVIPGFERALIGMSSGDTKTVKIPTDEAYGPRREDRVLDVSREEFPENVELQVGQFFEVQREGGGSVVFTVAKVSESNVTLDANHPLAGQDLTFDLELLEIL